MKAIRKGKEIKYVNNEEAARLVLTENWYYCPKYDYKRMLKQNQAGSESKE